MEPDSVSQASRRTTTTKTYNYKPLDIPGSIRLIVLEPGELHEDVHLRLDHVLLSDNPQYEALSYAWGDPSLTFKVFLGETCLKLGQSMVSPPYVAFLGNQISKTWPGCFTDSSQISLPLCVIFAMRKSSEASGLMPFVSTSKTTPRNPYKSS